MVKEEFLAEKEILINIITEHLSKSGISIQDRESLNKLLEIITKYTYENRLQVKGTLARTIIDSLQLDYSLGEKFISFDNYIR